MRDFTLTIYKKILIELSESGYRFVTFAEFVQEPDKKEKAIILRHDVDKKPLRSLRTAEMEYDLGINGTYYFRIDKNEFPEEVIGQIVKLGHEIGYHYEDLNFSKGDIKTALDSFQVNLAKLREAAPVETACMHGSPLSRHDNRELWKNFDYHELGIIGEPYFDVDFNEVLYLTDTGRRWDGERVSVRDRVVSSQKLVVSDKTKETANILKLHSTMDIINALNKDLLPDKIMMTIHPQRWNDQWLLWMWEMGWQKVKNCVKYFVAKKVDSGQ